MIQYFPSNYFEGFLVLQAVNLDYNGLYSAPNIGNIGHSLKIFAITNNKLREMDNKLTGGLNMTVLKDIRAQNNEIQYFEVAILAQMPKLDFLHLGENRLQHMDDPTVYLHPLNVAGWPLALVLHLNSLTCDKRLSWLLTLAKQGRMEENLGNQVECHRPLCLKGRDVMSLSKYGDGLSQLLLINTLCFSFEISTKRYGVAHIQGSTKRIND